MKLVNSLLAIIISISYPVFSSDNIRFTTDSLLNKLNISGDDTNKVNTLNELSFELVKINPDSALIFANRAHALANEIDFTKGVANSLYNIGFINASINKYSIAIENYQKSLIIYHELNDYNGEALCYNRIGNNYLVQSKYIESLEHYEKSLSLYESINSKKGIAAILNNIGKGNWYMGNFALALETYHKALIINKEIGNSEGEAQCYNSIGIIHNIQGNTSLALEYYYKSLEIAEKLKNETQIGKLLNNIAIIYFEQGKYELAVEYYEKSLEIKLNANDKQGTGKSYHNLCQTYILLGKYKIAWEYNQKSLEIKKEIGNKNGIAKAFNKFGEISLMLARREKTEQQKQKNYYNAIEYTQQSIKIADDMDILSLKQNAYSIMVVAYQGLNNFKKALEYHKLQMAIKDSLYNTEKMKELEGLEAKYQAENRQLQIESQNAVIDKQNAENKKQQILILAIFTGLLLFFILALVLYLSVRQKIRTNRLLSLKNAEISDQKEDIQKKNNQITDSIRSARRIQEALLPQPDQIAGSLPEHFILFKPRDIVSGDFYWIKEINDKLIVAVADCTGHGVPGAFMSMLGIAFLNEIIRKKEVTKPCIALEELRKQVKSSLKQVPEGDYTKGDIKIYLDSNIKDGMDIALCVIDKKNRIMEYSGANHPLYIIRNKEFIEIEPTKNPIGIYISETAFENREIQLYPNDVLYLFTDGYADQFGGANSDKFYSSRFKELLLSIHQKPMAEQKVILKQTIEDWQGDNFQVDDILVMGIKI